MNVEGRRWISIDAMASVHRMSIFGLVHVLECSFERVSRSYQLRSESCGMCTVACRWVVTVS